MEGDTPASSGDVEVQLPTKLNVEVEGDEEILINGKSHLSSKGSKEEMEEEMTSDDFIKIEKELIDVKEDSVTPTVKAEEISSAKSSESSNLTTNEVDGKIKALEHQLAFVAKQLEDSESEKGLMRSEVALAHEKLEKMDKDREQLESDRMRLKHELLEAEQKYNKQLESLQEALGALEVKQKELVDVKEAISGLSAELENSKQMIEEFESQLATSAAEARKFEELSNERSSHAKLEANKALEFEKMLEAAKLGAKEREDQVGKLQEELEGLCAKITENQKVEAALSGTVLELSAAQEKLEFSNSKIADLEQKLASGESTIHDLTEQLNLRNVSEEQMREDILALENLLTASKEDSQAKIAKLEELDSKLLEELKIRQTFEDSLKAQGTQTSSLLEELANLNGEKEALEHTVSELNTNLSKSRELCSELEGKLNLAEVNLGNTSLHFQQALSNIEDLEQKRKFLEDSLEESKMVAEAAIQKNLDLDALLQASKAAEEEVKAQLKETEVRLMSAEKQNTELEQQLAVADLQFTDADRELNEHKEKAAELATLLRSAEEGNELAKCHFQAYEDRVGQLESSLSNSRAKHGALEQELKELAEKCAGHEGRATASNQRGLELEDLVHASHSRAEDAGKKVSELELLLETANYRTQELENLLSVMETKHRNAEAESKQNSGRISEISAELEAFQAKSSSLEVLLQAANEKEQELADMLNTMTDEKKKFEELSNISAEKLGHAENLVALLQSEIKSVQEKLGSAENDLQASTLREAEMLERLRSAEEQLEHHGQTAEHATARSLELESLHNSFAKESELKLQEALEGISQKDSETRQLLDKLKSLDEQVLLYQDQAIEATEKVASLKAELEANAIKFVALEETINDLNRKLAETEVKVEHSSTENELLAGTNSKLRDELESHQHKVNDLHELLSSIHAEKEATAEQLASHMKTLAELTDEHSRGLQIQSVTESRIKETEAQLHEAIQKFTQRDSEARDLNEKLLNLEDQVRVYEEQVRESVVVMESLKSELEETIVKLQGMERLVDEMHLKTTQYETENETLGRTNLTLSQKLAEHEEIINELKATLDAVNEEKEHTFVQLDSSRKITEDLRQQVASDNEKLDSRISSILVEKNSLNEMYEAAKRDLEEVKVQMDEKLSDHKSRESSLTVDLENLKQELKEKALLQTRVTELEQQLLIAEGKSNEEIESIRSVAAEAEARLSTKLEEQAAILHEKDSLVESLRQFQKDKVADTETEVKDGVEVKSRDFVLGASTATKRKSKKRREGEGVPSEPISAHPLTTSTAHHSGAMAFKFVLGVALVSMVIGIILGKRY